VFLSYGTTRSCSGGKQNFLPESSTGHLILRVLNVLLHLLYFQLLAKKLEVQMTLRIQLNTDQNSVETPERMTFPGHTHDLCCAETALFKGFLTFAFHVALISHVKEVSLT